MTLKVSRDGFHRLTQTFHLDVDRIAIDEPMGNPEAVVINNDGLSDRHPGRYGNPLESLHVE